MQGQAGPISGWMAASIRDGNIVVCSAAPMESEIESEPFTPDLATRVRLQWFETPVGANASNHMIDDLRNAPASC